MTYSLMTGVRMLMGYLLFLISLTHFIIFKLTLKLGMTKILIGLLRIFLLNLKQC